MYEFTDSEQKMMIAWVAVWHSRKDLENMKKTLVNSHQEKFIICVDTILTKWSRELNELEEMRRQEKESWNSDREKEHKKRLADLRGWYQDIFYNLIK